ncbi:MAG: phosphonate C-P lyase system protein PhnG [Tabrizicola sp.]|uniref:phosphonate C-P lyase system protein PhnG n=1 Tax=Tabrizicola sp. TaxID=2005166 RepID=UPI002735C735|nr:phosphonate C-P lyase system protein PhnG [Tabrizicola sp.]MDP3263954.1 phosphonate C-P lyase system protein PhnG [Tabrizicola sp.]MDP3647319.1 phosphonate C-P lyase system protein PhnG [Paracoccaceae bacterium]MDZ4068761.1 phosphonate C-P lyase system protein PhnG [Tabrizicola sp.]MDZ4303944.1 phosphonate C-P lyase system protein PhnG [Pseudomonas sp.]
MTEPLTKDRQTWMSVLAKAAPGRLAQLLPALPDHRFLRAPEVGAVMVRGRIGGTGEAFNLGEMTVTRASVQLSTGPVGHAWVQGRDKAHATRAAIVDALMQTDAAPETGAAIVDVLAKEAAVATATRATRAATTKVDFFTLVRGEDK